MTVNLEYVDKYNGVGDSTTMIALILEAWDEDGSPRRGQRVVYELAEYRRQTSAAESAELAGRIFRQMVDLGEHLPDMYWVHVAVICSDLLKWGVEP